MEDWLHFILVFAPYVLEGVLQGTELRMWALLTYAVQHYFVPRSYSSRAEFMIDAAKACAAMTQFAQLAEEASFSDRTFTINLHTCVCRRVLKYGTRGLLTAFKRFSFAGCTTRRSPGELSRAPLTSWLSE